MPTQCAKCMVVFTLTGIALKSVECKFIILRVCVIVHRREVFKARNKAWKYDSCTEESN